ncbi:MAG: type II secretion system F family protein [Acidimicrobiales bacterium]
MTAGSRARAQARARSAALGQVLGRFGSDQRWYVQPGPLGLAATAAGVVLLLADPAVVVAAVVAAAAGWLGWRRRAGDRIRRLRNGQLPEALERIATAVRAGASLPQALGAAGAATSAPLGSELAGLAAEADHGEAVADVLDRWVTDHDDPSTRLAATALALAAAVGAAPARAIDGVAATLRERDELAGERRALATQARTSAVVLSIAPAGFALLLGATDPAAGRFLLRTPGGWACLVVGLGLDAIGAVWMTRLVRTTEVAG